MANLGKIFVSLSQMENSVKKVLFVCSEIYPYLPESEIATIGRYLPQGTQERKREIRSFMPRYGCINERKNQLHEVIRLSGMNIVISDIDRPLIIKVASIAAAHTQVYFIDNEDYFKRKQLERDDKGVFFEDNDERAIFFARGVLETVKKLRWVPDIIHCQGWMSAVVPLYVKTAYHEEPSFANTKVVTSLFTQSLEKDLGTNFKKCLEFREAQAELLQNYSDNFDFIELGKLAIDYSDGIVQADSVVNETLLDYAKTKDIPLLGYQQDFADAYETFYEQLFPEEAE